MEHSRKTVNAYDHLLLLFWNSDRKSSPQYFARGIYHTQPSYSDSIKATTCTHTHTEFRSMDWLAGFHLLDVHLQECGSAPGFFPLEVFTHCGFMAVLVIVALRELNGMDWLLSHFGEFSSHRYRPGLCFLWLFLSHFFIEKLLSGSCSRATRLQPEPESRSGVTAAVNLCLYVIFSAVVFLSHCLGLHIKPI